MVEEQVGNSLQFVIGKDKPLEALKGSWVYTLAAVKSAFDHKTVNEELASRWSEFVFCPVTSAILLQERHRTLGKKVCKVL